MGFNGAVHPFSIISDKMDKSHFFASTENRNELFMAIKRQLKLEVGNENVGDEKIKKCLAHIQVARNNFLADIQEYAAQQEQADIEAIYMGQEQTSYNHLIEVHNGIGVYLPVYFFFPLHISIKKHAFPIFVGSSIKLSNELKQLGHKLKPEEQVKLNNLSAFFQAEEEELEDFESTYESVEKFWPCFSLLILQELAKRSLQNNLPLFIF